MIIEWKEEYKLGIVSIDAQHRKLIVIINALADAINGNDSGDSSVGAAIEGMKRYAEEHLAYEERLFERCGYEEATKHRAEHDVFRETLQEFRNRFRTSDSTVALEMLGYLEEWFLHHVLHTDRKYVESFKTCGIE